MNRFELEGILDPVMEIGDRFEIPDVVTGAALDCMVEAFSLELNMTDKLVYKAVITANLFSTVSPGVPWKDVVLGSVRWG